MFYIATRKTPLCDDRVTTISAIWPKDAKYSTELLQIETYFVHNICEYFHEKFSGIYSRLNNLLLLLLKCTCTFFIIRNSFTS